MELKSNKALSLLEVIITVGILSTAIVFLFRSFAASLATTKFSQNITLACYLAKERLWLMEEKQKDATFHLEPESGTEKIQSRDFNWRQTAADLAELPDLVEANLAVSWKEGAAGQDYTMSFLTYLKKKK